MKTKLFISLIMTSSLSLFTGCNSDNDTNNIDNGKPIVKLIANYDNASRTLLNEAGDIYWSASDVVSINGATSTNTVISDEGATATFTAAATPTYYAFYPASMVASFDETTHMYSIIFPATQTYKDDISFVDNVNPAVAKSENTYLSFLNLCGMLRMPINTNIAATKARFVSNEPISGAATVTVDNTNPTMTMTGSGKTIDITSLPTTEDEYWLNWVLPARTYSAGWKIQLLDANNNILSERVGTNPLIINRSKITLASNGGSQTVNFRYGIPYNGLYWAKGNLCAPTTASYNFANAQETFIPESPSGYYFGFNTLNSQNLSPSLTTYSPTTDPCQRVQPAGKWRTPTGAEMTALKNGSYVWATKNSVEGMFFGTATVPAAGTEDNYLFLPAAGGRNANATTMYINTTPGGENTGYYWCQDTYSSTAGTDLSFSSSVPANVTAHSYQRGFTIRCVSAQ